MTPYGVTTLVTLHKLMGIYMGGLVLGVKRTLVQGFCLFWLFLMGCKELTPVVSKVTWPLHKLMGIYTAEVINSLKKPKPCANV